MSSLYLAFQFLQVLNCDFDLNILQLLLVQFEIPTHFFAELQLTSLVVSFYLSLLTLNLVHYRFNSLRLSPLRGTYKVILHEVLVCVCEPIPLLLPYFGKLPLKFASQEIVPPDQVNSVFDGPVPHALIDQRLTKVAQVAKFLVRLVLLVQHLDVRLPLPWLVAEHECLLSLQHPTCAVVARLGVAG